LSRSPSGFESPTGQTAESKEDGAKSGQRQRQRLKEQMGGAKRDVIILALLDVG
jgi:hypothetical protein